MVIIHIIKMNSWVRLLDLLLPHLLFKLIVMRVFPVCHGKLGQNPKVKYMRRFTDWREWAAREIALDYG